MANNIITAAFSSSTITYTKPAYQYDYGMILKFSGIELPQAYEVHFSNTEFCGESISQIGDETGVTIPDEMFLSGNPIYAWTYLHAGEDDGETVYKTVISINKRAQPSDIEPTPVQQDVITQAIAALNVAVEQTAADVVAAGESAEAAANSAEAAGQAKDDAVEAKDKAVEAKNAAETAQGKAEDAQRAAEQAAGSVLGLTADATVDANVGTPSVEVDVTTESDHKNMSFSFHNLKGVQGDTGVGISSVVLNADYTLTITLTNGTSYTTSSIRGEVGATPNLTIGTVTTLPEGSQATATITGTDEDPVLNLGIPVGDTGDPGISPTITVTEITGGHEVEVVDAEGTQTFDVLDGEVTEDALEERLIDKADVITSSASGEIVTIADGGDDLPVVDLKVSLLPVQDLHGQDAPYPAGGGKNKLQNLQTTQTISGVTFTVYSDGSVNVNGTATELIVFTLNDLLNNYLTDDTNYILSGSPSNSDTSKWKLRVYNRGTDYIDSGLGVNIHYFSDTTQKCDIVVYSGTTMTNVLIKPMIRLATVADATFAPYSNICPISGWTGVEVYQAQKNLWNGTVINGIVEFPAKVGATYTVSAKMVNSSTGKYFYVRKAPIGTEDWTTIGQVIANTIVAPKSFTAESGYKYGLWSNASYTNVSDVQIEFGSTATSYEPYQCTTYPIDWTDEAGTVYGCSLDVTSGVLTVDNCMVVLSDLVRWSYNPNQNRFDYDASIGLKPPVNNNTKANMICSMYRTGTANNLINFEIGANTNGYIRVKDARYTTVAAFKEAVSGVQLVYELATPLAYQLSETQIATFLGVNNFWSNGNGQIDLEYRCDTKLYIENLTKPSEDDMTANANIASSKFFMIGNRLFLSTTAIAQGEQIAVGTNCSEISLADALNQINA